MRMVFSNSCMRSELHVYNFFSALRITVKRKNNVMYEIIDVIHDYLFVTLRLRDVQTGATRDWTYWDDLEEWMCKEHGVKDLKGLVLDKLPDYGDWAEAGK